MRIVVEYDRGLDPGAGLNPAKFGRVIGQHQSAGDVVARFLACDGAVQRESDDRHALPYGRAAA